MTSTVVAPETIKVKRHQAMESMSNQLLQFSLRGIAIVNLLQEEPLRLRR
jgi:hypothetical protein